MIIITIVILGCYQVDSMPFIRMVFEFEFVFKYNTLFCGCKNNKRGWMDGWVDEWIGLCL